MATIEELADRVERLLDPAVEFHRLRADLADIVTRRLRDLVRAERVFQLVHADLPGEFPALRSLEATPPRVIELASAYRAYVVRAATISPGFTPSGTRTAPGPERSME